MLLVAAGLGTRLGADTPKALALLRGRPLVHHAALAALRCPSLGELVVLAPLGHVDAVTAALPTMPPDLRVRVLAGGHERPESVRLGLGALGPDVGVVLVHDAARALTPVAVFARVVAAVREHGTAVVPGLPVIDTVKEVGADDLVVATPDRARLRAIQTPQGFPRALLERAHLAAGGGTVTDDASLVERAGLPVRVVLGDPAAAKVTTAPDLRALHPTLLVLAGLPGTGKSTLARAWCSGTGRAHVRVDTIEQALLAAGAPRVGAEGYAASQAVATDLLRGGLDVVADSVNPVQESREAWRAAAASAGARVVEVELVCSDLVEHERRVSQRVADIAGHRLPTWSDVRDLVTGGGDVDPGSDGSGAPRPTRLDVAGLTPAQVLDRVEELTA